VLFLQRDLCLLNKVQNVQVSDTRPNGIQPGGQQAMTTVLLPDSKE
jgi:hypothetical protein